MRIGVLKESLFLGGTERSASNISKVLAAEHEVFTILYDGSNIQYPYGGTLVDLGCPARKSLPGKVINNLIRLKRYKDCIKKYRLELLYEFISISNPLCAVRHSKQIRIISARDFSALSSRLKRFHKCLSTADAMICNSLYLKKYYLAKNPCDEGKVFTVYNVIDTKGILAQSTESTEPEFAEFCTSHPKTVVAVGRFCKEKGFEYLLQSIAKARIIDTNIGLVLIGAGTYYNGYTDLIKELNLSGHVYFTGYQKNPYKYMSRCSCFVLSSLSEGFPNVLAEAMSLRLPVIATNCLTGPAEILREDGKYDVITDRFELCDYGILTPRFDKGSEETAIQELSRAIVTLLSSPELMKKYSELAETRAAVYSGEAALKQLNEIFHILKERRGER